MAKHKTSKPLSFLRTISPDVWKISPSFGNKFLIFNLFFFNRKGPILNSSDLFTTKQLFKVNKYEFFKTLTSLCEKFIWSTWDGIKSPSILKRCPKEKWQLSSCWQSLQIKWKMSQNLSNVFIEMSD